MPAENDLPRSPFEPVVIPADSGDVVLPPTLTIEEAYRTTVFFVEHDLSLEDSPSVDFNLFYQYMLSDPAASQDFTDAIRRMKSRDATL